MKPVQNLCHLACSLVVLAGAAACAGESAPSRPGAVGESAPAYAAVTLAGDSLALADLRGQAVLLNIWATWCPPCREEMPDLEALQQQYAADGLQVVGVSIDGRSAAAEVSRFLEDHGINFTILHDPEERVTRTFRSMGVPESYLIDRDGRVVQRWFGKISADSESVQRAVRQALGLQTERSG